MPNVLKLNPVGMCGLICRVYIWRPGEVTEEIAWRPFLASQQCSPKVVFWQQCHCFSPSPPTPETRGSWNKWLALSCLKTCWHLGVQVSGLCGVWHCAETLGRSTQETGIFTVIPNDGTGNPVCCVEGAEACLHSAPHLANSLLIWKPLQDRVMPRGHCCGEDYNP